MYFLNGNVRVDTAVLSAITLNGSHTNMIATVFNRNWFAVFTMTSVYLLFCTLSFAVPVVALPQVAKSDLNETTHKTHLNHTVAHSLTSTEDISDTTINAISQSEKAANEAEIDRITNIKKSPLANPNAALVELAFKFGRGNKRFSGYDAVYAHYCSDARDGNANAQFALGWLHEYGKGVTVDKSLAKVFYSIAAEQHHSLALKALPRLGNEMDGVLPKCMLAEPIIYVVEKPQLTRAQVAAIEAIKAKKEQRISKNLARAERIFKRQKSIYKIVKKLAKRYKVDPKLVMSFIAIESAFDVYATSPRNAQGLMQLIPKTARRFGVKDPYNPKQNIKGIIPKDQVDDLCIISLVWIDPSAATDANLDKADMYKNNYEATKLAIKRALNDEPSIDELIANRNKIKHCMWEDSWDQE